MVVLLANLSDEPPSDTAKLNEEKEELLRGLLDNMGVPGARKDEE